MLPNIELYFVHGWGYDNRIWNGWLPSIRQNLFYSVFDRGYFKNYKKDFSLNISGRLKILITHSFGLHLLPLSVYTQMHLLVLISGFRYFHEYSQDEKISRKRINLMKQRLVTDPRGLLSDFHTKCGLHNEDILDMPVINQQLLHDDLLFLEDNQVDLAALKQIPLILFLHGNNDQIVDIQHSVQLNKQLPHSKLYIHENAEHALPLTNASWCMNIIQAQLNSKIFLDREIVGRYLK